MSLKATRCRPTSNPRTKEDAVCNVIFRMVIERVGLRVERTEEERALGHLLPSFIFKLYRVASDPSTSLKV